jgi:hypothetical protein
MAINSSAARLRRESVLEGHLAAAREKLDRAVAGLLEAATAVVSEDAQLRKALAEGEQQERRRLQAILLHRISMHPFESDPVRGELLQLLEAIQMEQEAA